jgi:hypothetical protein
MRVVLSNKPVAAFDFPDGHGYDCHEVYSFVKRSKEGKLNAIVTGPGRSATKGVVGWWAFL